MLQHNKRLGNIVDMEDFKVMVTLFLLVMYEHFIAELVDVWIVITSVWFCSNHIYDLG